MPNSAIANAARLPLAAIPVRFGDGQTILSLAVTLGAYVVAVAGIVVFLGGLPA